MILVVSGPGGVGKGTVVKRLLELDPQLWLSRSWTTRKRRPSESEDAYVFVDEMTFRDRIAAGGFVEWTEFPANGCFYGTPTLEAPPGKDVLLEIELDGAQQVRKHYPEAFVVFVVAPSTEELESRLRGRGDDAESVDKRLRFGMHEERAGRELADQIIVNDDVERAAGELAAIVESRRHA